MNKKFYLILFTILLNINYGYTQQIIKDVQTDGHRNTQTGYSQFARTKGKITYSYWSASMQSIVQNGDTIFYYLPIFYTYERHHLPIGSKCLLKLDNEEIITLINDEEVNTYDNDYVFEGSITKYIIYPKYLITPEIIDKLRSHEITKVRYETTWSGGFTEIDSKYEKMKEFKLSQFLVTNYDALMARISIQNTVYDGF